jgi:hypothetical protein
VPTTADPGVGGSGATPIFLAKAGLLWWSLPAGGDADYAKRNGTMIDGIKAPERGEDLLAYDIADEALEAAAEKSKPAFTLVGSPTVSILVACCG